MSPISILYMWLLLRLHLRELNCIHNTRKGFLVQARIPVSTSRQQSSMPGGLHPEAVHTLMNKLDPRPLINHTHYAMSEFMWSHQEHIFPMTKCEISWLMMYQNRGWARYLSTTYARTTQLLGEVLILVQIMGIIHISFLLVNNVKLLIFPMPDKNAECRILWIFGQRKTCFPKYQWWPERSMSLTPVLVPNCLNCLKNLVSPIHLLGWSWHCPC